jgi:hypothetical protein
MAPMADLLPTAASRFGGPLGRAAWEAICPQEERKEYAMTSPKDAVPEPEPQIRIYYRMPEDISTYTSERWDEFATLLAERMINDLKNARDWPDSEEPTPINPKTEEQI